MFDHCRVYLSGRIFYLWAKCDNLAHGVVLEPHRELVGDRNLVKTGFEPLDGAVVRHQGSEPVVTRAGLDFRCLFLTHPKGNVGIEQISWG